MRPEVEAAAGIRPVSLWVAALTAARAATWALAYTLGALQESNGRSE
jgi:hypothetical protein